MKLSMQQIAAFSKSSRSHASTDQAAELILSPELTKDQRANLHGITEKVLDAVVALSEAHDGGESNCGCSSVLQRVRAATHPP